MVSFVHFSTGNGFFCRFVQVAFFDFFGSHADRARIIPVKDTLPPRNGHADRAQSFLRRHAPATQWPRRQGAVIPAKAHSRLMKNVTDAKLEKTSLSTDVFQQPSPATTAPCRLGIRKPKPLSNRIYRPSARRMARTPLQHQTSSARNRLRIKKPQPSPLYIERIAACIHYMLILEDSADSHYGTICNR